MKRRTFLGQSTRFSVGALLLPSLLHVACRKESLFEETDFDGKVLIIGAGAAGLYAGYILQSRGIDFQILEASDRVGGRLGKLEGFADYPLDLGAQWLHGRNSILGDLAQQTNTKFSLDNSDAKYWFKNELISELPENIDAIFEEQDGLPDISFKDHAIDKGFGNEYNFIVENLAGDQGAAASKLSVAENIREEEEWSSGDDDFKFRETFFDLINSHIVPKVIGKVSLSTVVAKVDYSGATATITDSTGNIFTGDKVIVAVPLPILQDGDIDFVPALPGEKTSAFNKIGFGAGMKVFLKFSEAFYEGNIIGGEICAAYADETEGKQGNDHVLLAFVMGEQAEYLTGLGTNEAIVNALLDELDGIYNGAASQNYLDAHVQDWTTEPFVRGAYSYASIGIGDARKTAAASIDDKLFFAGEAMNLNGHHQTVHGAVETGYREVINILESVEK